METSKNRKGIYIIIIIILVLVFGSLAGYIVFDRVLNGEKDENNKTSGKEEEKGEKGSEPENTSGYSWIVEPELGYDEIWFIESLGEYIATKTDGESVIIDPYDIIRGITNEGEVPGMGAGGGIVIYDAKNKMWGTQSYDSGAISLFPDVESARENADRYATLGDVFPVASVTIIDMTKMELYEEGYYFEGEEVFNYNDKYAYANKNGLITDFVFDRIDGISDTKTPAVCKNNKWGFINEKGDLIISYEFEDAISIDDLKAFVKVNGKWGIISKAK